MLIPFKQLIQDHGIRPRGVFHIGANTGQEYDAYMAEGVMDQVWIEPIPQVFEQLIAHVSQNPSARCIQACVSDKSLEHKIFRITNNNGESSSFLKLKEHLTYHPTVLEERCIEMLTLTADDIIKYHHLNMKHYNFLNLDIQGAELLALKGMEQNLKYIDYVYTEVNERELYEGCAMVHEIDQFLAMHGFAAVACKMTDNHWGDKFYVRK